MNRRDLRRLAIIRLREAKALLEAKCYDGAYYLCGYAAECGLKACIAKNTKKSEFPDYEKVKRSYTHDLPGLVRVAGYEDEMDTACRADSVLKINWATAKDWSEKSRYELHSEQKAKDLYKAITDRQHGVMKWIRQRW